MLKNLKVKIFADGADFDGILELDKNPIIKGFTTNPTLMRAAGINDYEEFAKKVLSKISKKSFSFEVFADDEENIIKQALKISSWQDNVSVKIPVTNTKGVFMGDVIKELSYRNISLNITAIMTTNQVERILKFLNPKCHSIISIFAGRIADTGQDPIITMTECKKILQSHHKAELLWASPREIYNIFQAEKTLCDIITVPHSILAKIKLIGKDLEEYSKETVQMFFNDAKKSKYFIRT